MKELEKIKELFLTEDLDAEDYEDNRKRIEEWQEAIINNENIIAWQEHDITKAIAKRVKTAYREHALILINNRNLSEAQRNSIWAKQDACQFLLSLLEDNGSKEAIEQIKKEIERTLEVV